MGEALGKHRRKEQSRAGDDFKTRGRGGAVIPGGHPHTESFKSGAVTSTAARGQTAQSILATTAG